MLKVLGKKPQGYYGLKIIAKASHYKNSPGEFLNPEKGWL